MAEIHDTLRRLLENPELQNALAKAFYTGIESPNAFDEYDLAEHLQHTPRRMWHEKLYDVPATEVPEHHWDPSPIEGAKVAEAIQTYVTDKLPQPAAITVEDLTSVAESQLAGVPLQDSMREEEVARAYRRFVELAVLEVEGYRCIRGYFTGTGTPHFPIKFGYWTHCSDSEIDSICDAAYAVESELRLWTSISGFRLSVWNPYKDGCVPDDFEAGRPSEFFGGLTGFCTLLAANRAEDQSRDFIESIVKSLALSLTSADGKADGYAPITALIRGEGPRMISTCMSALYPPEPSDKGAILGRLHNAIVLLSYADQAGADPVALSLSFAAIESLVCEKDELPINKQIKRHVATLLVQDPNARTSREKTIGRLYDLRSQVMHGDRISASAEASLCVRQIAAGVLRSVASWMDNQERMGGDTSWKEFMDEVNAASRKPGMVVGVPDLSELIPDKLPT